MLIAPEKTMALNSPSPWISRTTPRFFRGSTLLSSTTSTLVLLFLHKRSSETPLRTLFFSSALKAFQTRASSANEESENQESSARDFESPEAESGLLDYELLRRVSMARNADEALDMIAEKNQGNGGVVCSSDCCSIITAALDRNNTDLAFSIFSAMRGNFGQNVLNEELGVGSEKGYSGKRWKWARPDVQTYIFLVRGLATSLRVSDAVRVIADVSRAGDISAEEVPFGKIVKCPICMIAIAVAQPQHGIQRASCSKCRYQYELFSGDVVSIDSEEISMDISAWEKGLRFLQIIKRSIPAAVHSIVVETPSGIACTHRFATKTVQLPAKKGERVTICLATPSNVYQGIGPFRFSAKIPGFNPGEPMLLMNHSSGLESPLLRAPAKNKSPFLLDPPVLFPILAVLATGDGASGIIDPSLPRLIPIAVIASIVIGTTVNNAILPQLNRLPQRMVDAVAIKQQLLSQYDLLQTRITDLRQAAEKEVWMLARMCQLENKIVAVGEPSYRARRSRVKKVRESLENSLSARIELIDSYAKISSMIEIEVEMDSNVPSAEAVSNAESIAEQIEHIMELESLEQRWRIQAEANDELERLLNSQPLSTEPA